jgi:RNA polymerase sigma-70 factor (ECF subfamily)
VSKTDGASDGNAVLLDDQDRSLWDKQHIAAAQSCLERALARLAPGPYQIRAATSAVRIDAPTPESTDWSQIAALYGSLRGWAKFLKGPAM